jgi:hypothetical protein
MKRTIRLTESDLHRIIKESVNKILKEEKGLNSLKKYINYSFIIYKNHNGSETEGFDIVVHTGSKGATFPCNILPDCPHDIYIGIEYNGELLKCRKFSKNHDETIYVGWGSNIPRFRGGAEGEFDGKAYIIVFDAPSGHWNDLPQNKIIIDEVTLEGAKKIKTLYGGEDKPYEVNDDEIY